MILESRRGTNTYIYWFWCGKIATLYAVLEPHAAFSDSFRELLGSRVLPGRRIDIRLALECVETEASGYQITALKLHFVAFAIEENAPVEFVQ
jgi:hypothetical protein